MTDDFIGQILQDGRIPSFDPVKRACLTQKQAEMMEPVCGVLTALEDKNDKVIMPFYDYWMVAQIVSRIYKPDGSARSKEELLTLMWEHKPTWAKK